MIHDQPGGMAHAVGRFTKVFASNENVRITLTLDTSLRAYLASMLAAATEKGHTTCADHATPEECIATAFHAFAIPSLATLGTMLLVSAVSQNETADVDAETLKTNIETDATFVAEWLVTSLFDSNERFSVIDKASSTRDLTPRGQELAAAIYVALEKRLKNVPQQPASPNSN